MAIFVRNANGLDMRKTLLFAWSLGVHLMIAACGSDQDAGSRQVLAMSHVSADPVGSFSVSDDGTYAFRSEKTARETLGVLSSSDFEKLNSYVSDASLESLYAHAEPLESDQCETNANGWYLHTARSTACFVTTNITDEDTRKRFDFFIDLFVNAARANHDASDSPTK